MATGMDVREILELSSDKPEFVTKESLMAGDKKRKYKKSDPQTFKRPEGMHRELWGLLWTDNKDGPPLIPTDTNQGYKQMKAKIGRSQVRPWKWMPFSNPARKDGAIFYHWRRVADEGKDYPFARFNKAVDIPVYSDLEYQQHLHDDTWTRQETDQLFEQCKRYDLRFVVIHDRWDSEKFPNRSIEDIKERYYNICNLLSKVRAPHGTEPKVRVFDAEHERKRKVQLNKLFNRTPEQVEEEEHLIQELKKIELRKKERDKKTQDLQKLITAADTNTENRKINQKFTKKKIPSSQHKHKEGSMRINPDMTGIKFPDFKQPGVSLRSQRMKLPATVGQKKTKAIEQVLEELAIEFNPIPTEEIVQHFNELRQDIVLLYELKLALANCEYEVQTQKHRHETLVPGMVIVKTEPPDTHTIQLLDPIPLMEVTEIVSVTSTPESAISAPSESPSKKLSEAIDVEGPDTPNKKRKISLEQLQSNVLKKVKQKQL